MPWTTLPTYTDGNVLTGAQLNAIAANINETAPAKVTAAGRIVVSTAPNTIAQRVPQIARVVGGAQSTTSTSFTDLITVGPSCATVATGTGTIFAVSAYALSTVTQAGAYMGVAVSGATTIAADITRAMRIISEVASVNQKLSYIGMFYGVLTPGNNTFTAKYASTSGASSATFDERELLVIPL